MSKRKTKRERAQARRITRDYLSKVNSRANGSIIVEMGSGEFCDVLATTKTHDSLANARILCARRADGTIQERICDPVLGLERGKTALMMQAWQDAKAKSEEIARIREQRAIIQAGKMHSDADTGRTRWHRISVPDLDNRSVLIGSHGTTDPDNGTVSALITYKDESGSYRIASETWLGGWEKKDGETVRKNVRVDYVDLTFKNQDEAQRAALMAIDSGRWGSEYESLRDESRTMRKADRLSKWEHKGIDMKRKYAQPKTQKPTGKSVRVPSPQK